MFHIYMGEHLMNRLQQNLTSFIKIINLMKRPNFGVLCAANV